MSDPKSNGEDRRRHRRIKIDVPARYLCAGGQEQRAQLLDVSVGGVALETDARPPVGVHIVIYIDEIGRTEGHVVRHIERGFAVEFEASAAKKERLADRLTYLANRSEPEAERSTDDRLILLPDRPADRPRLFLKDGRSLECRVVDISATGIEIESLVRPPIGEIISIGKIKGRVQAHNTKGVAIEFIARAITGEPRA